jgi:glycosyltransferase involved in cell wall biosynthesis
VVTVAEQNALPTLAIVIPAYNEEETIRPCVVAAINQTIPADEIIVVDNRSTDLTPQILDELIRQHPEAPLKVLRQDELQGLVPTRNVGFNAVTSEIIGRIDSDAVVEPNWVENVKKVFTNSKVDAATGPVIYYDLPLRRYMARADDTARKAMYRLATSYKFLFGTNMALRRSVWEAIKDEVCLDADIDMHEDIDLSVHIYDAGFTTVYASDMVAGMSSRRLDDTPKDFYDYVGRFDRTYSRHGIRKRRLRAPGWVFLALYPIAKGMRWGHKLRTQQGKLFPSV